MKKVNSNLIAAFLLLIFFMVTISAAWPWKNSGTVDEIAHHIAVGYVILTKGDFRIDTSHPPLPRYIVGLPVKLFMRCAMPDEKEAWRRQDRSEFGRDFFYRYNHQPHRMLFLARVGVVMVSLFCGVLLFVWSNALYGEAVALLSLLLFCFSPNIIAHSALATTDMVATCFMLLSVAAFWRFLKAVTFGNAVAAGVCLGLAQLSKYSMLLLYPLFFALMALEFLFKEQPKNNRLLLRTILIMLVSLVVLWAGYGFENKPLLEDTMRLDEKLKSAHELALKLNPGISPASLEKLDDLLLHKPFPLSSHILGILGLVRHGNEGHGTYFLGKSSGFGNPFYFLVALLIKMPVPVLIFLLCGLFAVMRKKPERRERVLLLTLVTFFAAASMSKLQLGIRYILPVFPFLFIIAARGAESFKKSSLKAASLVLFAWFIAGSFLIYPHYLSYFNELIGGPRKGYKYLRDSNLDWGQDLPALATYLKKNNIQEVAFEYFGQSAPESYGISARIFDKEEYCTALPTVYAISAQYIDHVQWAKSIKPVAWAGYSIFIYDLRGKKRFGLEGSL